MQAKNLLSIFWNKVSWLLSKFSSLRNGINFTDLKDYVNEAEHVSNLVVIYKYAKKSFVASFSPSFLWCIFGIFCAAYSWYDNLQLGVL